MLKARRKHTAKFKREAVSMVIDQNLSVAEVSLQVFSLAGVIGVSHFTCGFERSNQNERRVMRTTVDR